MKRTAPLHCLIYSHSWCVYSLESAGLVSQKSLLVELAQESHLAPVFGWHGRPRPGLAPLLVPPMERRWLGRSRLATGAGLALEKRLRDGIGSFPGLSIPLVLAADPPLARAALESGVPLLAEAPSDYAETVLLVHISDAPWLINAFHYPARFSVLWDIADLPSTALPRMAEVLARHHCLTPEHWGGFQLCENPARAVPDAAERRTVWRSLLAEHPVLTAAAKAA